MTDLECLESLLKRKPAERIVYWEYYTIAFAAIQSGMTIAEAYANPRASYESQKKVSADLGIMFQPVYSCLGNDFGGDSMSMDSCYAQAPATAHYPVNTAIDIWRLQTPDLSSLATLKEGLEFSRLSASEKLDNEPFNVTFNCSGPFTTAGELCGIERFCRWLVDSPALVHRLLRVTTDYLTQAAIIWLANFKNARIMLLVSEPSASNQVISPEHFKMFALPYIKELHENVLNAGYKHIFCHICGDQNINLKYWAEIPMGDPGIISIGHEIDIETAAKYFPNDIIHGNLNPVILQTQTPAEIYEATRKVIEQGKKLQGRYVFGQGCEIPPRCKKENVLAMIQAVSDFGRLE